MVHKNTTTAPRKEGTNQHMGFTVGTEDQGLGKQQYMTNSRTIIPYMYSTSNNTNKQRHRIKKM